MKNLIEAAKTVVAVSSTVLTVIGVMEKTFKWYERKHGRNNKDKDQPLARPIIKGV